MTEQEKLWRQLNFMEAFCGCEDCAAELKESVQATRGHQHAPRTIVSGTDEQDFSYMAGCLE